MNIVERLQEQARVRPAAAAIIDRTGRVITFAGLENASAKGRELLLASGLAPGDCVLVFQPMSAELYVALLSLFRAGMVAMFLDPSAGLDHIERCCTLRRPAGMIATPKAHLLRILSPALRRIQHRFTFSRFVPGATSWSRSDRIAPDLSLSACSRDTPALLTFTSGSTGQPKAAVRTHGFLLEQQRVLMRAIDLEAGATDLTTLPIFVLANLAAGLTSLIPDADLRRPGAAHAGPVLRQIDRHRPSRIVASPAFLERICAEARAAGRQIPGFERVFTGGAPVFPDHLERFAASFPGADIVGLYGSTEAEPIAHFSFRELKPVDREAMVRGAGLLAGRPVKETSVAAITAAWGRPLGAITAEEFRALRLPADNAGEIVVTGEHVLKGYLNGAGDEETKFRVDGTVWHRTGDCGYFDRQGRLWLLGRASAVIRDERGVLYPFAVECAARQVPGIEKAALFGRSGDRILFIQPSDGCGVDHKELKQRLSWAHLDQVHPVSEIPMDRRHNAKVDYGRLAKMR